LDGKSLAIGGIVYFVITLFWRRKASGYDLEIDDAEGIRLLQEGIVKRKVRRDRVRYVREWGSGTLRRLVVSEHGPVFTRCLWGGIGVPANLSDYEQIKARVLAWLNHPEP
jgi:hypothetical protein